MLIATPSGARRVFTNWHIGTFPVLSQIQTHEQEFAVDDQISLQPSNDYILISTATRENMPTRKLEPMKHRHPHQGATLSITDISNLGTGHYHPHDPSPTLLAELPPEFGICGIKKAQCKEFVENTIPECFLSSVELVAIALSTTQAIT